jgi:hypothetical protein
MSEKTKKNIILFSAIGAVVLGLGIAAIFVVPMIFKVDYAGTYRAAKEIREESYTGISEVLTACENMADYVDYGSTTEKAYGEYVSKCTAGFDEGLVKKVEALGATAGVQKDAGIKALYAEYKTEWDKISGATAKYQAVAEIYSDWHKYKIATNNSIYMDDVTDAQIEARYDVLVKSNNETLRTFGETAKEKTLVMVRAYRAYDEYQITTWLGNTYKEQKQHKDELRDAYDAANNDRKKYLDENTPEITTLAPVEVVSVNNLNTIFNKLYEQIKAAYIEHFDAEDGLCTVLLGVPICD